MTDLLKHVAVEVHCNQCGDFTVGADVIAESQRLLAQGCPGSSYECPPTLFATLLEPSAIDALQRAWSALERTVRSPVREVSADALRIALAPNDQQDPRAVLRWDDDGGYIPGTPRGAPS
jgi:hypothetical protein